jgi:predicted dehydrogenase/nucleoside-diphosphate-sugar epimerase
LPTTPSTARLRVAIVGAGYIADFHARAIRQSGNADLVAVCDPNAVSAEAFAARWSIAKSFTSLEQMVAAERLDAVHILVPPNLHHALAKTALEAGLHVLLEKPMCTTVAEADELMALAREKGRLVGVNQNMSFAGAHETLRNTIKSGVLGPIDFISYSHLAELPLIRFGPFDHWMVREPGNVMLEIGPHVIAALLDLAGKPDKLVAKADREVTLPGGGKVFRRWRISGDAGRTAIEAHINLGPGHGQRIIHVHGLLGSAICDLDANTCVVDTGTTAGIDFDRYKRSRTAAGQLTRQARSTVGNFVLARLKLGKRGNPYEASINASVASFYDAARSGRDLDSRISGQTGRDVIDVCSQIITGAGVTANPPRQAAARAPVEKPPTVLVFGGTGFIGKELVRQLHAAGHCVRVAARGAAPGLQDLDPARLEFTRVDLTSKASIEAAIKGMDCVYHLARVDAKSWDDNLKRDVEPTRLIGEACLTLGVRRLVYTGTIDSLYAGAKAGVITGQTPLDPNIERRNIYARAKAAAETLLLEMHAKRGLAVTVLRPGIVIGAGGNPFHWGVAKFASPGVCEVWGEGRNPLPFVLVGDVAAALVCAMTAPNIEGKTFNLADTPLLSARDYIAELERLTSSKVAAHYQPTWRNYLDDMSKWTVKMAVRHPDRVRVPSYQDWDSRRQLATFDCSDARAALGWKPASDRKRLVEDGIGGSLRGWLAATQ